MYLYIIFFLICAEYNHVAWLDFAQLIFKFKLKHNSFFVCLPNLHLLNEKIRTCLLGSLLNVCCCGSSVKLFSRLPYYNIPVS